jgi:hypothetical protein
MYDTLGMTSPEQFAFFALMPLCSTKASVSQPSILNAS